MVRRQAIFVFLSFFRVGIIYFCVVIENFVRRSQFQGSGYMCHSQVAESLGAPGLTQLHAQLSHCGAKTPASLGELVPPLHSEPHGAVWVDWHCLLHGGRRDLGGTSQLFSSPGSGLSQPTSRLLLHLSIPMLGSPLQPAENQQVGPAAAVPALRHLQ